MENFKYKAGDYLHSKRFPTSFIVCEIREVQRNPFAKERVYIGLGWDGHKTYSQREFLRGLQDGSIRAKKQWSLKSVLEDEGYEWELVCNFGIEPMDMGEIAF